MIDPKICAKCVCEFQKDSLAYPIAVSKYMINDGEHVFCPIIMSNLIKSKDSPPAACPYALEHIVSGKS